MTTKQDKELLNTIRRAKNAAKRYRYSQLVYISDDGTYSIHQLYVNLARKPHPLGWG